MSRYRFAPESPRSIICEHAESGRRNLSKPGAHISAGHELECSDAFRDCALAGYPGADGGPCLILLADEIADSESPPLAIEPESVVDLLADDGPEAVAPLDVPVSLAEAFAPPSVSDPESEAALPHPDPEPAEAPTPTAPPPPAPPIAAAPQPAQGKPHKGPKGRRR